jgi:hypothetical protein
MYGLIGFVDLGMLNGGVQVDDDDDDHAACCAVALLSNCAIY